MWVSGKVVMSGVNSFYMNLFLIISGKENYVDLCVYDTMW